MYELQKKNEGTPKIIPADTHTHTKSSGQRDIFQLNSLSSSFDEGPAYFIELICYLRTCSSVMKDGRKVPRRFVMRLLQRESVQLDYKTLFRYANVVVCIYENQFFTQLSGFIA